jgi:hypothetical protein
MAFLKYKTGAIQGKPLKRKVTPEETREQKKQYEKDRECKFIDSWKQDRHWLHHNVEHNVQGSYTFLLSKIKDFSGQKLQFSSTFF